MRYKIFVFILLFFTISITAQEHLEFKPFGFSVDAPKDWYKAQGGQLIENMNRFDLTDIQRNAMLEDLDKSNQVIAYYKYDPFKTRGIIPTINIAIKETKVKSFEKFKLFIDKNGEPLKGVLKNFVSTPAQIKRIDNTNVWLTIATYDYKDPTRKEVKLLNKMIYIYKGGFYITVSFIEEVGKEDNSAVFDEMLKTVKLYK